MTEKSVLGEVKDNKKTAATDPPNKGKANFEEVLLEHIGKMADHIGTISTVMNAPHGVVSNLEVSEIVKRKGAAGKEKANYLLSKLSSILEVLTSERQTGS